VSASGRRSAQALYFQGETIMSSSNERAEILRLVETGKLSASEGIQLLNTLERAPRLAPPPQQPVSTKGRWLRIRVTNLTTQASKVNVNLPLGLVSAGLRIGQRYAPELHGVDWDNLLDEIQRGANGKLVEVEDQEDNERVEIFVD
jgi:hypothetical protein